MSVKESSVRNLTKTLAIVSLLAPASGYSLGIGDIKLHSALNQNLNAEISLIVSAGEKAADIKVNLAPPDKFDEAGVPWASFLSKIKFTTVAGANGSVIIKLSSREAVKEPFLDLLLEVSWPKGSLYREFTVLLDPPAAYEPAAIPVLTSSESDEPEQQAVILQRQSRQARQVSAERSSEYGPTGKNDTLWKIAEQAGRQEGVSAEQMMIAMYEKNPHAFYKENVHALSAGKTLKIPEREAVLKFSRKQALAEYKRQTKAWENRLAPAPVEGETAPVKKDTPDNQLTLVAPTEAAIPENAIVAPENKSVPAGKADEMAQAVPKASDKEGASASAPINDALQGKVAELEKQLAMMQQILALKDQQLAALQNQPQVKPVVPEKPAQTIPGQTEAIKPVLPQQPTQPVIKPAVPQKPVQPVTPIPEATSSLNTYLIGGGGAAVFTLLAWYGLRRRNLNEKTVGLNLFASENTAESPEYKDFFSAPPEKDNVKNADPFGVNSLFSEFTFGDFDSFDTDQGEIDPVSEADVYLAYGRYQQAEELMREVIKDQPDRDECKLKLLEIFYSNENAEAFETYAHELAEAGKRNDVEFWAKVTEMGSELCRDSALFSNKMDTVAPKSIQLSKSEAIDSVEPNLPRKEAVGEINESDLNFSSFEEPFNNEDFEEISQATNDDPVSFAGDVDEEKNNQAIDFDLNLFTEEASGLDESSNVETQEVKDDIVFESFDFDFNLTEPEIKENDEEDLIVMEDDESDYLTDKSSGSSYNFANDFFNSEADNDIKAAAVALEGHDFDQQDGFDVFDLTDMDQFETKLDLAKAYIDMSDADAARDMAWEVLEKGSVEQKKIAQALLNDLK
jgi:pilus assembly protein FimV